MINYIKGMYKWLYSKKNLKYSLPLITAYVLVLYGPTLFKVYIRPWLQKNTYSSDGRIRFKKHQKEGTPEFYSEAVAEYIRNHYQELKFNSDFEKQAVKEYTTE